ncbi:unnamed protein product [marine sediment metagenome]|uniref:Uncharacterized protein n=1 Tax=marine sediment metagenome TaxID=412755 RepID=X1HUM8_9ZZZZ
MDEAEELRDVVLGYLSGRGLVTDAQLQETAFRAADRLEGLLAKESEVING